MKLFNLVETYTGDIPPRSTVNIYCGAGAFRDACNQLVSAFLLIYITFAGVLSEDFNTYMAQMGVISAIMIICRIWDALNDPIMGWIIEKTHFKWGKYKPWILLGAVLNSIVVLCLFLVRPNGWGFVACFAVFYFLWDTVYTINDIAYWSMLPSLTKDEKRRNKITSLMQIFISIGVFVMFGVGNLLPTMFPDRSTAWTVISIVVVMLFLFSQIILIFGCKEHVRSKEEEEKERQNANFKDIVLVLKKNKPLRINMIGIMLQYLGAGLVAAFGTYYGYLVYGYGSDFAKFQGGAVVLIITVMYAISTIVAQALYPTLSKKLTRKNILHMAITFVIVGYFIFFFMGFPIVTPTAPAATNSFSVGLVFLLIGALLLYFGQGLISVVMLIQMQSTIEYNEWKFGERKEAVASSMRAFTAKVGAAVQQGIIYGTLAASGLYAITNAISQIEQKRNKNIITPEEASIQIQAQLSNIQQHQLIVLGIGMVIIPLILMITCYILFAHAFKIDEKMYQQICVDLDKRHAKTLKTDGELKKDN